MTHHAGQALLFMPINIKSNIGQLLEEAATGMHEQATGLGKFYARGGDLLSLCEAEHTLMSGESVEVPNAGSGSYRKFFALTGFDEVKVIDNSSSAGDWSFGVRRGKRWYLADQSNRYPHYGFRYAVNINRPAKSFQQICEYL